MTEQASTQQPRDSADVQVIAQDGREILLVGTAHVSRESADLVRELILAERPDRVCIELDAQRCLQFVRSTPEIASAVVGMRDPSHVEENLALMRIPPVDPEALEALWKKAAARSGR